MNIYVPIEKFDPEQRMVWGYASTPSLDSQGERVTVKAIEAALPEYMRFANIREMHRPSAVGKTKTAEIDENGLYIGVKVVDEVAWQKVKEGVYGGFSIGGRVTQKVDDEIQGIDLVEISLVDRPANPGAVFDVWKCAIEKPSAEEKAEGSEPNTEGPSASEKSPEVIPATPPEPTIIEPADTKLAKTKKETRHMDKPEMGGVKLDLQKANLPQDATVSDFVDAAYTAFAKVAELEKENRELLDMLQVTKASKERLKEIEGETLVKSAIADDKIDAVDSAFYSDLFKSDPVLCAKRLAALPSRKYLRIRQSIQGVTEPVSALSEIERLADGLMAKDVNMKKSDAYAAVLNQNPTLSERYRDEIVKGANGGDR